MDQKRKRVAADNHSSGRQRAAVEISSAPTNLDNPQKSANVSKTLEGDGAMWKLLGEILTSKKAIATMAGVLIVATNKIGLQLPEEAVTQIIGAIAAYVVSQGLADFGKAAK